MPAASAPKVTTDQKVDKVLSQLDDFNLRIGDLFRTTSGGIAGAAAAASEVNGTPVAAAAPSGFSMGGMSNVLWIGLAVVGAVLLFVFRKKFK